jgi:hypothetical protein
MRRTAGGMPGQPTHAVKESSQGNHTLHVCPDAAVLGEDAEPVAQDTDHGGFALFSFRRDAGRIKQKAA